MINGFATKEGTQKWAEQYDSLEYRDLNSTGLMVSQAGFGSYRVDLNDIHLSALSKALRAGVNLIDTSSNYSDGGSEELVGEAMQKLIESGDIRRDQVVVVSKVGYLQGQNYELSQSRKQDGREFKELVVYSKGLEHCIHPEFLEDQLNRSLERLNMDCIDVYLLHNPEYYLGWAKAGGMALEEARKEYYRRIQQAFQYLEKEVEGRRIQYYGVSSNTFPKESSDREFSSLEEMWGLAEGISKDHHFRVIQLPMNLFERGAAVQVNQPSGQTVLRFARDKNLGVLINRPLNAIIDNKLIRLADVEGETPVREDKIQKFIEDLIASETKFKESLVYTLELNSEAQKQMIEYLSPGSVLINNWKNFINYTQWYEVLTQYFSPRVNSAVQFLTDMEPLPMPVSYWMETYVDSIHRVFRAIDSHYKVEAAEKADKIKRITKEADGDWSLASNLSQMAVRALRSTEGVCSVLVGMRQDGYVDDVISGLSEKVVVKDRMESWQRLDETLKAESI
ncbi:MAG: aldo/keto reductase [bacterium]|nr:MAG: aldo/keto reductase [bacterium]